MCKLFRSTVNGVKELLKQVKYLFFILTLCLLVFLGAACRGAPPPPPAAPTETLTPQAIGEEPTAGPLSQEELIDQVVVSPTPAPTATPGPINDTVAEISDATGINTYFLLGLNGEDWLNLLVSVFIALLGIFVIVRIVYFVIRRIIKATTTQIDDQILEALGGITKWFLWILIVDYSVGRLLFISAEWKQSLDQVFRSIFILLLAAAFWKLIDLMVVNLQEEHGAPEDKARLSAFIPALQRTARVLILLITITVLFNVYGVNVTYMLAIFGIGGLALSLAAQDTISDAINGFLILLDQPYREGDRIGIEDLDTWGDVIQIGTRSTRIRTRDNRMVIVPNSKIGKNQVVNYSYPDPRYRIQTEVSIAYGSDLDEVRAVLRAAVHEVEGVLPDKPVDALLVELGDSALKFSVRWWIDSYTDTSFIDDAVHSAILGGLAAAGIESPLNAYDIHLKLPPGEAKKYLREIRDDDAGSSDQD